MRGVYLLVHRFAALVLLVAMSPLLLAIAFVIGCTDGAPVIFGHYRVGSRGRLFRCLKFRTMATNSQQLLADLLASDPAAAAQWKRDHKLERDPRITAVGAFLRRTSLDELPQLWNVVRGEMVLVGPRPITVAELTRYGLVRWHYLSVPPGMTGLWQVSGRNALTYDERVELDRRYVEHHDWFTDLAILARTVKVVLLRHGAR
jgi:exopolysaccharide production protein ExoY